MLFEYLQKQRTLTSGALLENKGSEVCKSSGWVFTPVTWLHQNVLPNSPSMPIIIAWRDICIFAKGL